MRYCFLFCLALGLAGVRPASAQDDRYNIINEEVVSRLANNQTAPLDSIPLARYKYYIVKDSSRLAARHMLYRRIGHSRHPERGRKELVQMLNRNIPPVENLLPGDTLVVPLEFDLDLRAYSPLPRYYAGAAAFDKLVVIDKSLQAFGAYEQGRLMRWGIIATGGKAHPTPSGRYNFNWKVEERISSLSPPDQEWLMRWVFNFHNQRGIHVHQYPLPVDGPVSHGCVRMTEADSKWLYHWADGWTRNGKRVVTQGTTLIIIGDEPDYPRPFIFTPGKPTLRMAQLPADPYSIPPGTDQQRIFDRQRARVGG